MAVSPFSRTSPVAVMNSAAISFQGWFSFNFSVRPTTSGFATSPEVQAAACRAAGAAGLGRLIPALIDKLESPHLEVQQAAVAGLEQFLPEERSFGTNADRWREWYRSQ